MSMTTYQIPQDRWPAYFECLSSMYQGWGVTVEVLGRELGDQRAADGLPLQGVSFEIRGSEAGDILIEAGDSPDEYMAHHVDRPRSVRVAALQPGAEADIQIESQDGVVTLVRLRRRAELPPPASSTEPTGTRRTGTTQ